jgi:hypothetical protein
MTEENTPRKRWTKEQFDEVAWDWLDGALKSKPEGYTTWLSKQHTGFCGTRLQTARYAGDEDENNCCPCCGKPKEDAAHLLVCPDEDRTQLLKDTTEQFEQWMLRGGTTCFEIAYWVPKYILYRGTKEFAQLGMMSPAMLRLARSQDKIGYRNFMEGRISKHFYDMQRLHLETSSSHLNGGDWMRQFATKVIHITHSQWIYRNFVLHDRKGGYLRLKEREQLLLDIELLMDSDPSTVAPESKFLLEFDIDQLGHSGFEAQQYWVAAVKAAVKAGSRRAVSGSRAKRIKLKTIRKKSQRERLGLLDVERQIRSDGVHLLSSPLDEWRLEPLRQNSPAKRRPHPSSLFEQYKSNKRKKPD